MSRLNDPLQRPVGSPSTRPISQPATSPKPAAAPQPAPAAKGWTPAARKAAGDSASNWLRGPAQSASNRRGGTITTDVADANDARNTRATSARFRQATQEVARLRPAEANALASLKPQYQQEYGAVGAAVAKNPVAQVALQQLLLQGKLGRNDSQGKPLLDTLARLSSANTPLAPGVDRSQLVSELVQELAQPSSIDQANRNTCGPTTVSIFLASTRPAEYARITAGLASPQGTVTLASGQKLQRVDGTLTDDGSHRTSTQRLLEPALMDFGDGTSLRYDNAADKHSVFGHPALPGATPAMIGHMLTGLLGRKADASVVVTVGDASVHRLEAATARGTPVPTLVNYDKPGEGPAPHWVLTTHVDANRATIVNPWGREESMPRAEWNKRIYGVAIPG